MSSSFNRRRFIQSAGFASIGLPIAHTPPRESADYLHSTKSLADTYLQKKVERYSLDHTDIPEPVLRSSSPKSWTHWERGPVQGLQQFATTPEGVVWLGGPNGAARFDPASNHLWDRWQYFGADRWLVDSEVHHIYIENSPEEAVWIRTSKGVSRISWMVHTLNDKATYYDQITEQYHVRNGFVARSKLTTPGELTTSTTSDTDNDGLWTAMYLAAQAYRYAATSSDDARQKARRSLDAIMKLETITPIPGFYARTYRTLDEPLPHQDNGEWHPSGDGVTEWKGDTSSDESVGHYYAYALYYDLVANEREKEEIRTYVRRLTDYLIANDYDLIDLDGKPTRWGRWGEDYYETPEGDYEKALRSLELLSFLKTTYHITGDPIYQEAYQDRVQRGYAHYTLEYRRWGSEEWEINFSDDELYYLSIYPLLKYEKDPVLKALYMDNLRFTWNQVQPEMNALWNFMSAALEAGPLSPPVLNDSIRALERAPLDLIRWKTTNSNRIDIRMNRSPDRHGKNFLVRVLPPDERPLHKHNGNPYVSDGGDARQLMEPTYWLLPYWLGVYYNYIS